MSVDGTDEIELTPAASERLDRNMSLLRRQILREISRQYGGAGHRARVSEVESVVNDTGFFGSTSRTVTLILWVAIALSGISIAAALFIQIQASGKSNVWLVGSVTLITGATVGTVLATITLEQSRRRLTLSRSQREFIRAFGALEDDVRRHARELLGPVADNASLGRVISAVELLQLWTPEDSQSFRRLLSMRNIIVHEDASNMSRQRLVSGFAQMTRLSSLLDLDASPDIRYRMRASRAFEERIANALRKEGLDVSSALGDPDYDLLVSQGESVTKVVIKFRKAGILAVADIADVVDRSEPYVVTVIVTNVAVSPYVYEYTQLATDETSYPRVVSVVSWQDESDSAALVNAVRIDPGRLGTSKARI